MSYTYPETPLRLISLMLGVHSTVEAWDYDFPAAQALSKSSAIRKAAAVLDKQDVPAEGRVMWHPKFELIDDS